MPFHNSQKIEYLDLSIKNALESGQVTQQDVKLIQEYVNEKKVIKREIGFARELKISFTLIAWRKIIRKEYAQVTQEEVYTALGSLDTAISVEGKTIQEEYKTWVYTDPEAVPALDDRRRKKLKVKG